MSAELLRFGEKLIGKECVEKYLQGDFFDQACLMTLISKILGWGIVAGAAVVKLPQILRIVAAKSVAGIDPSMFVLETIGYTISVAYNIYHAYPFSTYGENIFLLAQGYVLVVLMGLYGAFSPNVAVLPAIIYAVFAAALFSGSLSPETMATLSASTVPIFAASRVPQIIKNFKDKSTGQLSVITLAMNFFGSLARVFTVVQEVNDMIVLLGVVSGTIFNGILFLQVFLYRNSRAAVEKDKKKK